MRRLVALVAVVGLSCLGLVSAGTAAGAKVVGANGQITFARFDPNVGDTVAFIANADGTGLRALFPGVQTGLPRWSPDGSRLAIQAGLDNPCPPCAASTIILNPDTGSYRILSPRRGDRAAFEVLLERHRRMLTALARRAGDPSLIEDVAQEIASLIEDVAQEIALAALVGTHALPRWT